MNQILKNLESSAGRHGTDKLRHGYLPFYAEILRVLKDQEIAFTLRVLEIGVCRGASLRMWHDLSTGLGFQTVGVDIAALDPSIAPGCEIIKCDTTDPRLLGLLPLGFRPSLIVDDGSHRAADIVASFELLWPVLAPGGWYVIEDLCTQCSPRYNRPEPIWSWVGRELIPSLQVKINQPMIASKTERLALAPKAGMLETQIVEIRIGTSIIGIRKQGPKGPKGQ